MPNSGSEEKNDDESKSSDESEEETLLSHLTETEIENYARTMIAFVLAMSFETEIQLRAAFPVPLPKGFTPEFIAIAVLTYQRVNQFMIKNNIEKLNDNNIYPPLEAFHAILPSLIENFQNHLDEDEDQETIMQLIRDTLINLMIPEIRKRETAASAASAAPTDSAVASLLGGLGVFAPPSRIIATAEESDNDDEQNEELVSSMTTG